METLSSTLTIIDGCSKVLNAIEEAAVDAAKAMDQLILRLDSVSGVNLKLPSLETKPVPVRQGLDLGLESSLPVQANELSQAVHDIGDAAQKTQQKSRSVFSRLAEELANSYHAALGVFAALEKIGSASVSAISRGDEIAKTSRALHINAQAYQELDYAMQRGGASHEGFVQGLKMLSGQMAQLDNGSQEVARAFQQLGLSQKDLAGKDLEASLYAISGALSQMEDKGKAAKATQTLLGDQGYKMASALAVGTEELEKLREEARKTGVVMDDMTLELSEHGADELLNAQLQMQSIWQRLSVAIMPAVVKALEQINALFSENSEAISQISGFFGQLASSILPVLSQILGIVMRNVQRVFEFVQPFMAPILDFISAVSTGIEILADKFGDMILTIGGVVGALMAVKAVMIAISAHPIVAIIAGTLAIISFIEGMRQKSEEFYAVTTKIGIGIAMGIDALLSGILGALQTAGNAIGRAWTFVTGFVMKAFGAALGKLASLWNKFLDWLGVDSLKLDMNLGSGAKESGEQRMAEALDLSKDFYFSASQTFDELSARLKTGSEDLQKSGRELGWEDPSKAVVDKIDEATRQDIKGKNAIINTMNSGVKIDKDSILFMKEMATAEIVNRYNNISPSISQNFNSNQPLEPRQVEALSASALDAAINSMRAAI